MIHEQTSGRIDINSTTLSLHFEIIFFFIFPVDLLQQLRGLGLETASDLQDLIQESSFKSFWNRVYLVGPYSVGKSCLAKILVGEPVPDSRESTDGIWIYFGRAGMDVNEMKWIYFEKGISIILRGFNCNILFLCIC